MRGVRARWVPLLLVGLALAAAGVAASGGGLSAGPAPPPEQGGGSPGAEPGASPAGTAPPDATGEVPGAGWTLPGWIGTALTVVVGLCLAAAVLGLVTLGVRHLLFAPLGRRPVDDRPSSQPEDGPPDPAALREAVRAGLADLDAGADPRKAVIACWLRLERAAAVAGTARLAADTPEDLVLRLLAAHRVDQATLEDLAAAYRRARYAPAEVPAELADSARQALAAVAAQLPAPMAAPS